MEEKAQIDIPAPGPVPIPPDPEEKGKSTISIVVLTLAAVAIVAGIGGGAYYLGSKGAKTSMQETITPTPAANVTNSPLQTTNAPVITQGANMKTVTGGLTDGSTSFKTYSLQIPPNWTDSTEKTELASKLSLINGAYAISIYQAPMGGGGCLYPGDADVMMAQNYTDYVDIKGTNKLRRSWNKIGNPAGTISYTVCQNSSGTSYGSPTTFGAIGIKSPDPADQAKMAEIDTIISSLKAN